MSPIMYSCYIRAIVAGTSSKTSEKPWKFLDTSPRHSGQPTTRFQAQAGSRDSGCLNKLTNKSDLLVF